MNVQRIVEDSPPVELQAEVQHFSGSLLLCFLCRLLWGDVGKNYYVKETLKIQRSFRWNSIRFICQSLLTGRRTVPQHQWCPTRYVGVFDRVCRERQIADPSRCLLRIGMWRIEPRRSFLFDWYRVSTSSSLKKGRRERYEFLFVVCVTFLLDQTCICQTSPLWH